MKKKGNSGGALFVGLGIFLSRIAGLVRERVFAHFFGSSDYGDAFKAALKIPNFLQNLFGEGVLSASFIPVYAKLIGEGKEEEAGKLASIVGSLLFLVTSVLVTLGIFATPYMIDLIAPGFTGEKRQLTIDIVQILFPGTGILVISAWCLGILNSHKKFFLPYVAPVLSNITMIAALLFFGINQEQKDLALTLSYSFILGSFLQFAIQVPSAFRLTKNLSLNFDSTMPEARTVIKNFFPVVVSRGVVQVSAYIDNILASLLPSGAVSALSYAQTLYLLPISLFGMSISVAELPSMSQAQGNPEEVNSYLRKRLNNGLSKISFFVIPSAAAFLILGNLIVGLIFQTGAFTSETTQYVWMVLAGSTIGLLPSTQGRLYSSTFYSLKDTTTPLKFALLRVLLTTVLGFLFALTLPKFFGLPPHWGTVGLTLSSGIAAWTEYLLLKRSLSQKIGITGTPKKLKLILWLTAISSALAAYFIKNAFLDHPLIIQAFVGITSYGLLYLSICYFLQVTEAQQMMKKILRK